MRIERCLLLLLAHYAEHSWNSGNARSHTAKSRRSSRKRGDDDTGACVSLGMYVHEKYSGTCGKADCGIRTVGSDEHNQSRQYCGVWATALQPWDLCMLSSVCLVYVPVWS